ncbi:oxidoreductase [Piscinibacter sp. Jin2]|uniref:Oxidoreductase n=1 Tax=Aquariibacter lacus TaxID=2801332 RepID=A0A9X0XE29_9BURK|nr:MDR family oxidoreductase [Piscinibacter lacus]MBL0719904.1 oxidoreductase [Piscinibacter lacus]
MFQALLLEAAEVDGRPGVQASVRAVDDSLLPPEAEGQVTLAVHHSTLNYKDGLAICRGAPIVRQWPLIAGIDGAGTVLSSRHPDWQPGDEVLLNGWGVGEGHHGCLAERARLSGDWLIRRPAALGSAEAMAIGTAGYTAMLCLMALERHGLKPGDGEVLVTGATGGVGSVAVALLASRGHRVVAATGKAEEGDFLRGLGAAEVIDRAVLSAPGKPLQRERWAGVVDSVGSHTLVNALAQTRSEGAVAACGLAQGADLPATVMPFILRGVSLLGINSVTQPRAVREAAWARLATELDRAKLAAITQEIPLAEAPAAAARLLAGQVRGRLVVRIGG